MHCHWPLQCIDVSSECISHFECFSIVISALFARHAASYGERRPELPAYLIFSSCWNCRCPCQSLISLDQNRVINYSVIIVILISVGTLKVSQGETRYLHSSRDKCSLPGECGSLRPSLAIKQSPAGVCLSNHHTFGGPPLSPFSSSAAFFDGGATGTRETGEVGTREIVGAVEMPPTRITIDGTKPSGIVV
jgi:hypothetical protein